MIQQMLEKMFDHDLVTMAVNEHITDRISKCYYDDFDEGEYVGQKLDDFRKKMLFDFVGNKLHRLSPWLFNKMYKRELLIEVYTNVLIAVDNEETANQIKKMLVNYGISTNRMFWCWELEQFRISEV